MLCLEAGAWNTGPRLLLGVLLSTPPPSLWSLLAVEARLPSLRGLIPAGPGCPGVSSLLEASLVFTFLLPLSPWYLSSVALAPPVLLQPCCATLTRRGAKGRQQVLYSLLPGGLGGKH